MQWPRRLIASRLCDVHPDLDRRGGPGPARRTIANERLPAYADRFAPEKNLPQLVQVLVRLGIGSRRRRRPTTLAAQPDIRAGFDLAPPASHARADLVEVEFGRLDEGEQLVLLVSDMVL